MDSFPVANLSSRFPQSTVQRAALVAALLLGFLSPSFAQNAIMVGRTASGQLKVQASVQQPLGMVASVYPGMRGYCSDSISFQSASADQATNDFFQLGSLANLRCIVVAKDTGLE